MLHTVRFLFFDSIKSISRLLYIDIYIWNSILTTKVSYVVKCFRVADYLRLQLPGQLVDEYCIVVWKEPAAIELTTSLARAVVSKIRSIVCAFQAKFCFVLRSTCLHTKQLQCKLNSTSCSLRNDERVFQTPV